MERRHRHPTRLELLADLPVERLRRARLLRPPPARPGKARRFDPLPEGEGGARAGSGRKRGQPRGTASANPLFLLTTPHSPLPHLSPPFQPPLSSPHPAAREHRCAHRFRAAGRSGSAARGGAASQSVRSGPCRRLAGLSASAPGRGAGCRTGGRKVATNYYQDERPNGRPSSPAGSHREALRRQRPAGSRSDPRDRRGFFDNGQTLRRAWR